MVSLGIHRRSAVRRMPGVLGRGSRKESGADHLVPLLDVELRLLGTPLWWI